MELSLRSKSFIAAGMATLLSACSLKQMAKIAERRISAKHELQEIEGIGEARTQKYGEAVIKIVAEAKSGDEKTKNETKEQSLLFDTEPGKS